ncbi:MAG: GAF domain-containing protein [Ignavibacteria bacterium]|nr:GAF domain-containing protein [Ignavibacteria bacterium]
MVSKTPTTKPVRVRPMDDGDERALRGLAPAYPGDEFLLLTDTGRIIHANETFLSRSGYTLTDVLAMTLPQIEPANTRAAWLKFVSTIKGTQNTELREVVHVLRDGSRVRKDAAFTPVHFQGKNYILCVCNVLEAIAPDDALPAAERDGGEEIVETPLSAEDRADIRDSAVLATVTEAVIVVNARGVITDTNSPADRILGLNRSNAIGRSCADPKWRLVDLHGDVLRLQDHPVMAVLVGEEAIADARIAMLLPDGSTRGLLVNATPMFDDSRTLCGAVASIRLAGGDTGHARTGAAAPADMTSDLLTAHREITWEVLHADSVDEIERKVTDLLVRTGEYPLVWFGRLKDSDRRVHPSTWAGAAAEYLLKIKVRYDDSEHGSGPVGEAIKTGVTQVVDSTQDDERFAPWRQQSERAGLLSLAAFPLAVDGEVGGALTVYGRRKNQFREGELSLLQEIAEIAAFGITVLASRAERRRMRTDRAVERVVLDAMLENPQAAVALFTARAPFRTVLCSAPYLALLGQPFREKGVRGLFLTDYLHAHAHTAIGDRLAEARESEDALWSGRDTFRAPTGEEADWRWSIHLVKSGDDTEHLLYTAVPAEPTLSGAVDAASAKPDAASAKPSPAVKKPRAKRAQ